MRKDLLFGNCSERRMFQGNRKSHQANPYVHQQHIVWATTFRYGLPQPLSTQMAISVKKPFDLIKAGATQTETSLLKQYVTGERVDSLDDYDFPARTITGTERGFGSGGKKVKVLTFLWGACVPTHFHYFFQFRKSNANFTQKRLSLSSFQRYPSRSRYRGACVHRNCSILLGPCQFCRELMGWFE